MADDHPIPAYPLMFDSSQWTNKYSPFYGKALPWPSQYQGVPTDALGRPIQSYTDTQAQHDAWAKANPAPVQAPGKTLNSPAWDSNGNANAPGSTLNPMGDWSALAPTLPGASPQAQANYARDLGLGGAFGANAQQGGGGAQGVGGARAAAPTNPYDMNQAYLTALANPGKVTTPGATVAQSAPPSAQSGVLQQFLANWQNKGSPTQGAGNYDNSGFFNALKGMV